MRKLQIIILHLFLSFSLFGNDGVYITSGSNIYPTNETKISLEKEILSFSIVDKMAKVAIEFVFNNPENTDRTLLIGFQAPTPTGDVSTATSNTNPISNFTVVKDGEILPYNVKVAECEDCELKDSKELHFTQSETGVYVFLFEMTFRPGLNRVNHSYHFPASSNVIFNQTYDYILTTGSKWANSQIKDLTVNINMGDNQYFFVNDVFGPTADWSIIGTGKVSNTTFEYLAEDTCQMIRVLSGQLQIHITDFEPTKNIGFGIINEYSFISIPIDFEKIRSGEIVTLGGLALLDEEYTKSELRLMRNTIYAQYGYDFSSTDLKIYFSQFDWYMPNPNLKMEDIELTEKEKEFIDEILISEMK